MFAGLAAGFVLAGAAHGEAMEPPLGYLGIAQNFEGLDAETAARGFFAVEYGMTLETPRLETLAGTFWANQFDFLHSSGGLPANVVKANQGGYLGLQAHDGRQLAIVSIWWASEAEPGPGAECVSDIEAWYGDDRPWEPPLDTVAAIEAGDPARPVEGGPFRSCRLALTLKSHAEYRLRLAAERAADGRATGWWSAWVVEAGGAPMPIGRLRVPDGWGGIEPESAVGFMEHFAPLPQGCDSVPASRTVFAPAVADDGAARAVVEAGLYGFCAEALRARTEVVRGEDGGVVVGIR